MFSVYPNTKNYLIKNINYYFSFWFFYYLQKNITIVNKLNYIIIMHHTNLFNEENENKIKNFKKIYNKNNDFYIFIVVVLNVCTQALLVQII